MKRERLKELVTWHQSASRKPLIIRGARQVGKSTLVSLLAKELNLRLVEVNLEKRKNWNTLFESNDVHKTLREIEGLFDIKINRESGSRDLLFFDECQSTPAILNLLRYFYEELPELPVIAAGSLLDFALEKFKTSLPVGRIEFLYLGPMTFKEYLWAIGEEKLTLSLESFSFNRGIAESVHERLLQHQREFLFIGGMPEAVHAYSKNRDPKEVRKILAGIIDVYKDDFNRYASGAHHLRMGLVLEYALNRSCEKVKYSNISKEYEAKELKKSIHLLSLARVITKVCNTSSSAVPLSKGIDESVYKLLSLDVGLTNAALNFEWRELLKISERELLHEGPLAEQFVGQHMLEWRDSFIDPDIYYWLREGKSNAAEVDFVVQSGRKIVAIEVKAGASGSMRSLHQWNRDITYPYKKSIRFDLNLPSKFQVKLADLDYQIISLPLYFASFDPLKLIHEDFEE